MNLTASQRRDALLSVAAHANELGMPEVVSVSEAGVVVIANAITAARWSSVRSVPAGDRMAPLTVTKVVPLAVTP